VRRCEKISQPVILSEAKDLALPMELADGEGTQSEILRFAQNDSACIFLPFADFFTASEPWEPMRVNIQSPGWGDRNPPGASAAPPGLR
jgi:hypothetical protein